MNLQYKCKVSSTNAKRLLKSTKYNRLKSRPYLGNWRCTRMSTVWSSASKSCQTL